MFLNIYLVFMSTFVSCIGYVALLHFFLMFKFLFVFVFILCRIVFQIVSCLCLYCSSCAVYFNVVLCLCEVYCLYLFDVSYVVHFNFILRLLCLHLLLICFIRFCLLYNVCLWIPFDLSSILFVFALKLLFSILFILFICLYFFT